MSPARSALIGSGNIAAFHARHRPGSSGSVEGHRVQIEDFALAVRQNREPAIAGRVARRSVELICAIYESDKSGQIVRL